MNVSGRGHENAELIYKKYGIGPCLNYFDCKKYVKIDKLNYPLSTSLQQAKDGLCRDCFIKNQMNDINYVENVLDIFIDIDKAILWQPILEEQIPQIIVNEMATLEAWIMRNKRLSMQNSDNIKHQRFVILHEVFQKFILAQDNRGGKGNTHLKIKRMKDRITAIRNNDTFKLVKHMKDIIKNMKIHFENTKNAIEEYKNMDVKRRKAKDEINGLKRAKKAADKGAWHKAYFSMKSVDFVDLDNNTERQLFKDKFIGCEMTYAEAIVPF